MSFQAAWDREVAERFKQSIAALDGSNVDVVLINRKSYLQLQSHYDILTSFRRQAALVTPSDPLREHLFETLRTNRRSLAPHQEATHTSPVTYNHSTGGLAPFGNPHPLNAQIAAYGVEYNPLRTPTAPFNIITNYQQARDAYQNNPLGSNFKRNKYCWRCGFQKKLHSQAKVPFGQLCSNNCLREDCSKCGERVELHTDGNIGPYCIKPESTNSQCFDWYKHTNNTGEQETFL